MKNSYIVKYRYQWGEWTTQTATCIVNVPVMGTRGAEQDMAATTVEEKSPHKDKPQFKITSITGPVNQIYDA